MKVNQKTRQLTDDWSRNAPEMIAESAQGVDTKMVGAMAAGSVVIGIASTTIASTTMEKGLDANLATIPLGIAVILYFVVLGFSIWCLWPSDYRRPTNPEALRAYWSYDRERVLMWHSNLVLESYKINLRIRGTKVRMLYIALLALAGETLMIMGWMACEFLN